MLQSIEIPIATGELIDKITILEIKVDRITDPAKVANVRVELALLCQRRDAALASNIGVDLLAAQLKLLNKRLWELEDQIRDCERRQDFGPGFVTVARGIYRANDERAALKREFNLVTGSKLIEEKSYASD
jgi:hypothetical protein